MKNRLPEDKPQVTIITKHVCQEYENGELVRERTVLNDGGLGQERAEAELKEIESKVNDHIQEALERQRWEEKRRR